MNIIFVGFKNVGKTTLGKQLAEHLQCQFIDTDDLLQDLYNHIKGTKFSVAEIYKLEKEQGFRSWEHQAIESLQEVDAAVIATGGGSVLLPENREIFKKIGKIIYLKATDAELLNRQENTRIPTFINKNDPLSSFEKIYAQREPIYQSIADLTIEVENKDLLDIIGEIYGSELFR